jgi:hypothetical protein
MTAKRQEVMVEPLPPPLLPKVVPDLASSFYGELRRLASAKMHFERGNYTVQPTAVVRFRQQLSPIT